MMKRLAIAAIAALFVAGPVAAIDNGGAYLPPSVKHLVGGDRLEQNYKDGTLTERERTAVDIARTIAGREAEAKPTAEVMAILKPGIDRGREVVNEAMLKERGAVMRLMGLDPDSKGKLYILVSASMSDSLIQAYAREAMWCGAVLVVRGIPPGVTFKDYMKSRVTEWVRNKGATAMVEIDPRPFSMYGIKAVPAIVYTEVDEDYLSGVCSPDTGAWGGVSFSNCGEVDEKMYWKLEGAVTLSWALDKMISNGATGAQQYLDALGKAGFSSVSLEQRPFVGNWAEQPTPAELEGMNADLASSGLEAYLMPQGVTAVGPKGITIPGQPKPTVAPSTR